MQTLRKFKRTSSLLKVKKFNDIDLECVGFEEGANKNKGTLGAILLSYKGNIVQCGMGFSDELRDEIWSNQSEYLGRIAEISYFEETESASGLKSLRFPVFKDFRDDKSEPILL